MRKTEIDKYFNISSEVYKYEIIKQKYDGVNISV